MSIIYEPSGKAREYSPLAANIYTGCNHGCLYCYAPGIRRMTRQDYKNPEPRRNFLQEFEKDCKIYYNTDRNVLFCFMSDCYNSKEKELRITREALKVALKYKIPIAILTKSKNVLDDLDIFKKFGSHIKVGYTLTFDNEKDSLYWEAEAALPKERLNNLKILHNENILTWASFEPVINPEQSLSMMKKTIEMNCVDFYKIGKLNHYKGLDKQIDWTDFLNKTVELLRDNKKPFYIKKDLRQAANSIKLYGNEVMMDEFNLEKF